MLTQVKGKAGKHTVSSITDTFALVYLVLYRQKTTKLDKLKLILTKNWTHVAEFLTQLSILKQMIYGWTAG